MNLNIMDLRIFSWNILTLKMLPIDPLVEQLKKYKADITAVQEMRWKGNGITYKRKCTVYYSCHDKHHIYGTGFIIDKNSKVTVIDFKPINERICIIRIKGKFFNYSIINCYAPTNNANSIPDEKVDKFYEDLDITFRQCPKHDIKILIGDFNAKIGQEQIYRPTIGKHSLHKESNANGHKLIEFAASKNMIIGSTMFPHKNIHKGTWMSRDNKTVNQIDHILIDNRHKSDLNDFRAYRGAKFNNTDHFLVGAQIKTKLSNVKKQPRENVEMVDISKLVVKEERYVEKIDEVLKQHDFSNRKLDVDTKCNLISESISSTAIEILGKTKRFGDNWFDSECEQATAAKNEAFKKKKNKETRLTVEDYRKKRRYEKVLHRRKKRLYYRNNIENVNYKLNGEIFNGNRSEFKNRIDICKDENDTIITDKINVVERWKDNFNISKNSVKNELKLIKCKSNSNIEKFPKISEIRSAIEDLKNNKSTCIDDIHLKLLKVSNKHNNTIARVLKVIFTQIWRDEKFPSDWNKTVIWPIYKNGDPLKCSSYDSIQLYSAIYKIFSNILCRRLKMIVKGYRRSALNHIFTLRQIIEKSNSYKIPTYHLFFNFIYESIDKMKLCEALKYVNVPQKLINLILLSLNDLEACVKIDNEFSTPFKIRNRFRKCDSLTYILSDIMLEKMFKDSKIDSNNIFNNKYQFLKHHNDCVLISKSLYDLQSGFKALDKAAKTIGFKICNVIKLMRIGGMEKIDFNIDTKYSVELIEKIVYLGTLITSTNDTSEEISKRIISANRCAYVLKKRLRSDYLSLKIKINLYKTVIRSVLTYGSEFWIIKKGDENNLIAFEKKILRYILGKKMVNGKLEMRDKNELYEYIDMYIIDFIKFNRLKWAGNVVRLPKYELNHDIMFWKPAGENLKGKWIKLVEKDMKILRIERWRIRAKNENEWLKILNDTIC